MHKRAVREVNDKHNLFFSLNDLKRRETIALTANETLGGCCSSTEQD